jgi:hypothetical protein
MLSSRTVLWMVLASVALPRASRGESPLTSDDVLHGLEAAEAAFQSFSVKLEYDIGRALSLRSQGEKEPEMRRLSLNDTVSYAVDKKGRARCEATGTEISESSPTLTAPSRMLAAFDGNMVRRIDGLGGLSGGRLTRDRHMVFRHTDPLNLVTHYFDKPVSSFLREFGARVVGTTQWDGRPVVEVETDVKLGLGDIKDVEQKLSFLIDVDRGFSVVRKATLFRYPPGDWVLRSRIEATDHAKDESGIWLPRMVVCEGYGLPTKAGITPTFLYRWNVRASEWRIDPALADSLFSIDFEEGTVVTDEINATSFLVKSTGDAQIANLAEIALARNHSTRWRLLSIATTLAIVVSGCALYLFRRRARQP